MRADAPAPAQTAAPALRVLCAMPYTLDTAPGQRFRWEQWAAGLRAHGVELAFVTFGTRELEQARSRGSFAQAALAAARRYPAWVGELARTPADLVVIFRNAALAGPPVGEYLLRALRGPYVYDFDDAIHLPPESGDTRFKRALRCDWRVAQLCRGAALVSVGNPLLAEFARQYNLQVAVWPTTVSLAEYTPRTAPPGGGRPVIGWSGSTSTGQYIQQLLPVLERVARIEPFELLVMGTKLDLGGLPGRCVPWSSAREVAVLHEMDIGLMPLTDTAWSRGKCALKAIQYMAVGTPAVVSDVGVNREVVTDGECGFVVRTEQEWVDRLVTLLRDPARRRAMGEAARARVEAHYSAEVWAPRIATRLWEVARR